MCIIKNINGASLRNDFSFFEIEALKKIAKAYNESHISVSDEIICGSENFKLLSIEIDDNGNKVLKALRMAKGKELCVYLNNGNTVKPKKNDKLTTLYIN